MSLERAQAFEAEGDADGAAREYVAAGAHQEAARVLTLALRPLDAAIVLFTGIAMIGPDLDAGEKSRAQLAAGLLREGGRDDYAKLVMDAVAGGAAFPSAVLRSVLSGPTTAPRPSARPVASTAPSDARRSGSSFVVRAPVPTIAPAPSPSIAPTASVPRVPAPSPSIAPVAPPTKPATPPAPAAERYKAEAGWHAADGAAIEETIKQFLATNRKGAAARVAWEAGQFERALGWFVELDLKYQAGSCLRSLKRPVEALAMLLEVPTEDQRYRRACFDIVALARETGRFDFELDRFLTAFVGEGPTDASECASFLELGELYASAGFAQGARRCAEGVLRIQPGDERAKALIASSRARGAPKSSASGDKTVLPSLEEFVALARARVPPRPRARK